MPSRRTVLTGAALMVAAGTLGTPTASATRPLRVTLPRPTGPHPVGTVSLHLEDRSRPAPWVSSIPTRELMISVWYPAARNPCRAVPWLTPGAAATFLAGVGLDSTQVTLPDTHAAEGVPVARTGRLPVVLYSPGFNASRVFNTAVVEDLASNGYLVVTVDHTYEALMVEFPGGRVVTGQAPDGGRPVFAEAVDIRVADFRFVLDRIADLDRGINPDVHQLPLPAGLKGAFDLSRVGMFGHSLGGATTASTMYADQRVKAGVSLDGSAIGAVAAAGLDRPYLVMDTPGKGGMNNDPALREFFSRLRAWRLALTMRDSAHYSYGDLEILYRRLASLLNMPQQELEEQVGTITPHRAMAIQRAYPLAFYDLHFRHRGQLLDDPSPAYPEVLFRAR
jgi:dienelactone hydrolase